MQKTYLTTNPNNNQLTQFKQCTKCLQKLNITEFNKDKQKKDGLNPRCRHCMRTMKKEAYRTKRGILKNIYKNQVANALARSYKPPSYTSSEFIDWCMSQDLFHTLHKQWKDSGYITALVPSVDRIDDYLSYTFSNIQLMTWQENHAKGQLDIREGRNNKKSKSVHQFDLDGKLLQTFFSINEAMRITGVPVSNICVVCSTNTNRNTAGGFKWQYA